MEKKKKKKKKLNSHERLLFVYTLLRKKL